MAIMQHCGVSYQLRGRTYSGTMRIEQEAREHGTEYRAVIETPPLHGTYGAFADSVELALDFLNLAMQAEGAENITFSCDSSA